MCVERGRGVGGDDLEVERMGRHRSSDKNIAVESQHFRAFNGGLKSFPPPPPLPRHCFRTKKEKVRRRTRINEDNQARDGISLTLTERNKLI